MKKRMLTRQIYLDEATDRLLKRLADEDVRSVSSYMRAMIIREGLKRGWHLTQKPELVATAPTQNRSNS